MNNSSPVLKTTVAVAALASVAVLSYGMYKMTEKLESMNATIEQTQAKVSNENLAQSMLQVIELHAQHKLEADVKDIIEPWSSASDATEKRIYGNLNASFTLVEFSDLECPYCKKFHTTPKTIVDESNGHVNWEWKHLPLGFHNPAAEIGAYATECVGQLKDNKSAWALMDLYFRKSPGNGAGVDDIHGMAKSLGVEPASFKECMNSPEVKAKVAADVSLATRSGVNGTPATFVVDNRTGKSILLGGAQPIESFAATMSKLEEHYQSTLKDEKASKPVDEIAEKSATETN